MRRRRLVGLSVLVYTLTSLVEGVVEIRPDGSKTLATPWTDADHSTTCPSTDSRPCPVLLLDNPIILIQSGQKILNIRTVSSLSDAERNAGAQVPFYIYNYKFNALSGAKRFTDYTGTVKLKLTFTFGMGRLGYKFEDASVRVMCMHTNLCQPVETIVR